MPKSAPTLADFSAARRAANRDCTVCDLPDDVRAQIDAARAQPAGDRASFPTIEAWLAEMGHPQVKTVRLASHYREHVK